MDITEQEAERIFKFIVKKLGYDYCRIENYYGSSSFQLIAVRNNKYYNYYDSVYVCTVTDDGYVRRIVGNSWIDMLKNVIQYRNSKICCYIYVASFRNRFMVPKTLDELRIMVDLES